MAASALQLYALLPTDGELQRRFAGQPELKTQPSIDSASEDGKIAYCPRLPLVKAHAYGSALTVAELAYQQP